MKMRAATTIRVSDNNIFIQPTQHLCHTICVGSNNDDDQRTTTQQYDLTIIDDKNSSSTDSHRVISSFLYICNLKHQESKSNRKHVHYWKIKPCFPFFHTCIHVIDICKQIHMCICFQFNFLTFIVNCVWHAHVCMFVDYTIIIKLIPLSILLLQIHYYPHPPPKIPIKIEKTSLSIPLFNVARFRLFICAWITIFIPFASIFCCYTIRAKFVFCCRLANYVQI